jgi:exodeoxyribonuclease VII large subunit
MQPEIITVSQFVGIINDTMAMAYPQVIVEGEVSSFKINQGKFVFFDLKDDSSTLSCFMMLYQLRLPIEDGMKIRVTGSPKVTKFSKFSLTVKAIELAGEGELRRAMELLKRKLTAEGLFDASRKRQLARFPRTIGLITSGTSAAYSDFIKILDARWGGVTIKLADVTVQGITAPDQIVGAIEYFNQTSPSVDVLVLIRGGGSLDDLSAFSTEPVARAVAGSRTPIMVGVGHEIDYSLADYAADMRAATPTDAARLVVPDRSEMEAQLSFATSRMSLAVSGLIEDRHTTVDRHLNVLQRSIQRPADAVNAAVLVLARNLERIHSKSAGMRAQSDVLQARVELSYGRSLKLCLDQVNSLERLLKSSSPQATLARGYAIVTSGKAVVKDAKSVSAGADLMIQLAIGKLSVEVKE